MDWTVPVKCFVSCSGGSATFYPFLTLFGSSFMSCLCLEKKLVQYQYRFLCVMVFPFIGRGWILNSISSVNRYTELNKFSNQSFFSLLHLFCLKAAHLQPIKNGNPFICDTSFFFQKRRNRSFANLVAPEAEGCVLKPAFFIFTSKLRFVIVFVASLFLLQPWGLQVFEDSESEMYVQRR